MLVVDLHTLQTIHCLNLIHNVFLSLNGAEDVENVGRGDASVGKRSSRLDVVVLLHEDLLGQWHEIMLLDATLVLHNNLAVTPLDLAHDDLAVDFGKDGRVGRIAGFEEFGDTRQTAGDIGCFADSAGDLDNDLADTHIASVFYGDVGAHRKVVSP